MFLAYRSANPRSFGDTLPMGLLVNCPSIKARISSDALVPRALHRLTNCFLTWAGIRKVICVLDWVVM